MRLLYLNPNSTASMTEGIVETARRAAPGAEILGWTNRDGPPAVQGPEDGAAALPGMLALLPAAEAEAVDAIVLACADDIGLDEIRAAARVPVIGLAQAAFHMAALLGHRFSVVTTLDVSVPIIAGNVSRYGFAGLCGGVHASGIPVLEIDEGRPETVARLAEAIRVAGRADGTTAAVLGCAGMAPLLPRLTGTGLALIDGVAASAMLAPAVVTAAAYRG